LPNKKKKRRQGEEGGCWPTFTGDKRKGKRNRCPKGQHMENSARAWEKKPTPTKNQKGRKLWEGTRGASRGDGQVSRGELKGGRNSEKKRSGGKKGQMSGLDGKKKENIRDNVTRAALDFSHVVGRRVIGGGGYGRKVKTDQTPSAPSQLGTGGQKKKKKLLKNVVKRRQKGIETQKKEKG